MGVDRYSLWEYYDIGMWKIETTAGWKNSALHFGAQYPEEMAALLRNLTHYLAQLKAAKSHKHVQALYLEFRESGIVSINQNGMEDGLVNSRMYVFPDESTRILYLLCVGAETKKDSDLEYCKEFIFYLVNERA